MNETFYYDMRVILERIYLKYKDDIIRRFNKLLIKNKRRCKR